MPGVSIGHKVQATQRYPQDTLKGCGVTIRVFGATYDDAVAEAQRIERDSAR